MSNEILFIKKYQPKIIKAISCLLFYVLSFCNSYAQTFNFKNYTVENGLPYIQIFAIYQDSKGYLWTGGYGGLSRFDGVEFVNYSPKQGLANHLVNSICEDKDGSLWVGTIDGISVFKDNKSKLLTVKDGLSSNQVNSIVVSESKTIWIGTSKGLNYFESGKMHAIPKLQGIAVLSLIVVNNFIFVGTEIGLFKYDLSKSINEQNLSESVRCGKVNCITKDQKGNIWIGTEKGLCSTNQNMDKVEYYTISHGLIDENILSLTVDSKNNIWIGSKSGLLKYNGISFDYFKVSTDINANNIRCLAYDNEGNTWIGTHAGLFKFRDEDFVHFGPSDGLTNAFVYPVIRDNRNALWLGTEGGGAFKYEKGYFKNYRTRDGLAGNIVNVIYEDKKFDLWFGTDDGLCVKRGEVFTKIKELKDTMITSFIQDSDEKYWIGYEGGLASLETKEGQNNYKIVYHNLPTHITNFQPWAIVEDNEKNLWISTYLAGVFRYDGKEFVSLSSTLGLKSLSNFSMVKGSNDFIYVSGLDGLYEVNTKNFSSKRISETDGLSSDLVYSLLLSNNNNVLWAGTNQGVNRIDLKKFHETGVKEIQVYGKMEGYFGVEANCPGGWVDADGVIWFGTVNGLIKYNPKEYHENQLEAQLNITSIKLGYKDTLLEFGSTLPYDLNNISFTFRGICFTNPEKVKYIYKLEGWEKSWSPETSKNSVQFSNLPAGTYTFKVRSCNNEGVWNLESLNFKFTINPPFWKRWWFIALLILFIIGCVLIVFRIRIQQVKRQQKREAKLQVEIAKNELKALRAQMNPHFLFNSLNSIMNYILNKNDDEAVFYLNRFARLMRMILNNSEKQSVTLREETDSLKLYLELEQMRFNHKFEYSINIESNVDVDFEEVPTMLIQPYVENAILHGLTPSKKNGNLTIGIKYQGDLLVCRIQDDGIGRKKSFEMKQNQAREHKSMGMKIANDRLRLLNNINQSDLSVKIEDLYDNNGSPEGTAVNIFIPIIR